MQKKGGLLFEMSLGMATVSSHAAVAVQLENLGVQLGDRNLREELVEHLQSHPYTHDGSTHLRDYLSAPVAGDDPFNADMH